MDRIDICYDGNRFTAPGRDLDDLKHEVDDLVGQGGGWLDASYGDGTATPAVLYVAAGIPVAFIASETERSPEGGRAGGDDGPEISPDALLDDSPI